MLKTEIKPGSVYAFREKPKPALPFQQVRVIEHVRGNKWKAEWIEPNPGLVHYIESGQLIVSWKEHKAFLREEADAQRLREHNKSIGYSSESPITLAVEQVFETVGDDTQFYKGVLSGTNDALNRVRLMAGTNQIKKSSIEYTDRKGIIHLPFDDPPKSAQNFSPTKPSTVLVGVEATEREWTSDARTPGKRVYRVAT